METKTFLLTLALLSLLTGSCQKDPMDDPNASLLLTRETYALGGYKAYEYNNQNQCSSLELFNPNNERRDRIEFRYNEKGLLAYIDFPLTDNYLLNSDSIIYNNDGTVEYRSSSPFGSIKYYYDLEGKEIKSEFYTQTGQLNHYIIDEYISTSTVNQSYYGNDDYFAGSITYTYDGLYPSISIFNFTFFQMGNIISFESDYLDEESNVYINFNGHASFPGSITLSPPYTSTFEYNIQGYPNQESRWYKDANEPLITYYSYMVAN